MAFGEDNLRRIRFNQCVVNAIKEYDSMRTVKLKEHWNESGEWLVKNGSPTEIGYDTYWRSFDSAMEFNVQKHEEFMIREKYAALVKCKKTPAPTKRMANCPMKDNMKTFFKSHQQHDRYHWNKDTKWRKKEERTSTRFWLLCPPK